MNLFGNPETVMAAAANGMNDYQVIQSSTTSRALIPEETMHWHKRSHKKLEEFFTGDRDSEKKLSSPTAHRQSSQFHYGFEATRSHRLLLRTWRPLS